MSDHDLVWKAGDDTLAADVYGLLTRIVVPRPIAFVSSQSAAGHRNLAPFSFFNLGGSNPPSLMFSPTAGVNGAEKDTLHNVRETREFVVNLVSPEMAQQMNETSPPFPRDVDEWEKSGLTPVQSETVAPPRVAESPAALECRLFDVIEHGSGPGAARYVIGEVTAIHVRRDMGQCPVIARLGGSGYLDLCGLSLFELERPKA